MPDLSTQATSEIQFPETRHKIHPTLTMKALQWMGKKDVQLREIGRPMITEPKDALVRVTTTTICGSDLHLYHGEFEEMEKGDTLGHEGLFQFFKHTHIS